MQRLELLLSQDRPMNQKLSEEPVKGQEKVSRLCKLLSNEIQRALGLMKVLRCWGRVPLLNSGILCLDILPCRNLILVPCYRHCFSLTVGELYLL